MLVVETCVDALPKLFFFCHESPPSRGSIDAVAVENPIPPLTPLPLSEPSLPPPAPRTQQRARVARQGCVCTMVSEQKTKQRKKEAVHPGTFSSLVERADPVLSVP